MSGFVSIWKAAPTRADVGFFLRALLTRPLDIPGILRREAAKRRANLQAPPAEDALGLRALTESWEAALAAGLFDAPPGRGEALEISEIGEPLALLSALQSAAAVIWRGAAAQSPAFPPLSLEAARLGLPQHADEPEAAHAARRAWAAQAALSPALRARLLALAEAPIGPA